VGEEVKGTHHGELHYLHSMPNFVWDIKSRRMKLAGHATRTQKKKCRRLEGKTEG
jgi:hypothetical protein